MVLLRQCSQKLSSSKSENKKSIAIAQKADRTAYDVQYSCRTKPSTYKVLSTLATIVAEFGDYSRQCGQGLTVQ